MRHGRHAGVYLRYNGGTARAGDWSALELRILDSNRLSHARGERGVSFGLKPLGDRVLHARGGLTACALPHLCVPVGSPRARGTERGNAAYTLD